MQEVKFERVARYTSTDRLNELVMECFTSGAPIGRTELDSLTSLISHSVREAIEKSRVPEGAFIFLKLDLTPSRLEQYLFAETDHERPFRVLSERTTTTNVGQPIQILWLDEDSGSAEEFTPEDARTSLKEISQALAAAVAGRFPDYRILFADQWTSRSVATLTEPYVIKVLHHEAWQEAWQGLDLLFSLKERSPYLSYAIPYRALDPSVCSAVLIEDRLSLCSLEDAAKERKPSELFRYVSHAAQAAQFLIENGLRLSDICPENIFIDREKDIGILRDYDGLRVADAEGIYIHRRGSYPPGRPFVHGPISEADMVYELGSCLHFLLRREEGGYSRLREFVTRMISVEPTQRPTIKEVNAELKAFGVAASS